MEFQCALISCSDILSSWLLHDGEESLDAMVNGSLLQLLHCEMGSLVGCFAMSKFMPMNQALYTLSDSGANWGI